jgi:SWI/SNF-related matrix-associated actin-dependent regulator of chromatin subfamily A3
MSQRSTKRPLEVIDLTQSSSPSQQRPAKTRRVADGPVYLPTPAPSSQVAQSSQPTYDEFPEDNLVDDVDLSQSFDSYISSLILYGVLDTKIVGCRFYNGYVTIGEMVMLQREPSNPYDNNAIKVLNVRGEQIGHIPRQIAAKLASFMDNRLLSVEACAAGEKNFYECPLQVQLYGSSDPIQRNAIKERMKEQKLPVAALRKLEQEERKRARTHAEQVRQMERKRLLGKSKKGNAAVPGGTPSSWDDGSDPWAPTASQGTGQASSQSLDRIIQEAERFNPRQDFGEMVDKFGLREEDLANMEMASQPAAMGSQLLPFQRQGLRWMLDRENPVMPARGSNEVVQLWKHADKPGIITNIATHFSLQNQQPELASGGILADDMGLGKTIQVISLIVADRAKNELQPNSKSTLILAPLGVMSNWQNQIKQHVKEEHALSVLIYHGTKRAEINPKTVQEYDVVITTYDTVMSQFWNGQSKPSPTPRPSGLFSINWRRIVLDEGHTIRNPQAKKSVATCNLMARSRWALTGTPIINTLKDAFSMIKFLRLSGGLDRWELFNSAIVRPVMNQDERALYLLQTLMQNICLRRKKSMPFVDLKLPELTEYIQRISFAPHEKEKYEALQSEAKGELERYRQGQGQKAVEAYHHLLEVLLRLRQVCNHWKLCGEGRIKLPDVVGEALDLTPENRAALQEMLRTKVDAQDDCSICYELLSTRDPVITACTHVFCYPCAERFIDTQHKCPMCRANLENVSMLLRLPQESTEPEFNVEESSSKVEALLQILRASQKKSGTKTVVFSQWTSFLDVVQKQLMKTDIKFTRIDGKMNTRMRDAAMKELEEDDQCTVLLASLGVCSVGLNLVAANQVVMADTWWAPAIEDQAVDRVHRLGQKKPCTVFRLIMEGSIEESVLKIQEDKRKLAQLAFADKEGKKETKKNARLDDIARILGS